MIYKKEKVSDKVVEVVAVSNGESLVVGKIQELEGTFTIENGNSYDTLDEAYTTIVTDYEVKKSIMK